MATLQMATVDEEEARKLLVALGYHSCDSCSIKALTNRLNKLPVLMQEATNKVQGELKDVQRFVCDSLVAGSEIVVRTKNAGERTENMSTKTETKGKKGKKGKAEEETKATKAPPAPTKEEEAAPKTKKGKPEKAAGADGQGVIGSIIEFLEKATEKNPISKKELAEKLAKRFPDRDADGMAKTINVQVPSRLKAAKNLNIQKNDKGYWIA